MSLPLVTCTKAGEVRMSLAERLGMKDSDIAFFVKEGAFMKKLSDFQEMGSTVYVKGLKTFKKVRKEFPHPHVIIGAGQGGLRQAICFAQYGQENFVVFERREKLGGTSWLAHANPTSKVQTELGTYHLNWSE